MKIHVTCSKDYDIYLQKGLLEQIHNYIDCQRKYLSYLMTMYPNVINRRYRNNSQIPIFTL